jgi:hypothetical protein
MQRRHLEQAERHICLGEGHISKQLRLIALLERNRRDSTMAHSILTMLGEVQASHFAHRDRILAELD